MACTFCKKGKNHSFFVLQVTSKKDQEQYWAHKNQGYRYVSVAQFAEAFNRFSVGRRLTDELDIPFDKARSHPAALVHERYALGNWEMFKACYAREKILFSRSRFVYIFKNVQVTFLLTAQVLSCLSFPSNHRLDGYLSKYEGGWL